MAVMHEWDMKHISFERENQFSELIVKCFQAIAFLRIYRKIYINKSAFVGNTSKQEEKKTMTNCFCG